MIAPADWAWSGFPLEGPGDEALSLDAVVDSALIRLDEAERGGDEEPIGPVLHWAHILKTEQGSDGAWPAAVNARTGESIGAARTLAPAVVMARLDALLNSSEYAACIARAATLIPEGEPDGTRG